MSADFISIASWLEPPVARRLFERLRKEKSVAEDVVDETGSPVFDPRSEEPYRPKHLASLVGRRAPSPEDLSTAYLDVRDPRWLARLTPAASAMSPNFPSIVVVDRVLAIPSGVAFMRGQPVARLRKKALDRLHAAWPALLTRAGGQKGAARKLAPYFDRWGNGYADASSALSAVSKSIERAVATDRDLLLAGMTVP